MADLPAPSVPPPEQLAGTPSITSIPQPQPLPAEDLTSAGGVSPSKVPRHDVVDTGWDADPKQVGLMIDGISNEEIWMLVRRLNKVVFHIKHTERISPDGLDLAMAPEMEFSPNKMRSQLERLYMGIIVGSLAFVKHVSRLRSWNEKTRTGVFCTVYFTMWTIDYLMAAVLTFLIAMVISPEVRAMAFPPAPISMVGSLSGDLTKPNAGILGSKDSITGAPENLKGEAVENESSNFVTGLAGIGVNIMSSGDVHGEPNTKEDSFTGVMKAEPNELAQMIATGKDKAEGIDRPSIDKSKGPMETIMWSFMRSGMIGMTIANDTFEKLANVLDPRPPFTTSQHRLRLVNVLLPLAAMSLYVTRNMLFRGTTFAIGFALFGRPVLQALHSWLQENHPAWLNGMSIEGTLLHGVPNNPQLALALLRHEERQRSPIPPPPSRMGEAAPKVALPLTSDNIAASGNDMPLGATPQELHDAAAPDDEVLDEAGGDDTEVSKTNSKEPHKILKFMKGAAKLGVRGTVALDKTRAKIGHSGAKNRIGVVPRKNHNPVVGPVEFDAYYEGEAGTLTIDSQTVPVLTFANAKNKGVPVWSLPVSDITALRKHSGYGFKTKLTAGWALDKQLNDSLGITDKAGNDWAVTAIPKRDALFNRLIAVGEQKWELW